MKDVSRWVLVCNMHKCGLEIVKQCLKGYTREHCTHCDMMSFLKRLLYESAATGDCKFYGNYICIRVESLRYYYRLYAM